MVTLFAVGVAALGLAALVLGYLILGELRAARRETAELRAAVLALLHAPAREATGSGEEAPRALKVALGDEVLRLEPELVARIEALTEQLREDGPGVLGAVIDAGLAAVDERRSGEHQTYRPAEEDGGEDAEGDEDGGDDEDEEDDV